MHDVACKRGRVGWKTEKEQGINIPKWDWKSVEIDLVSFVNSEEEIYLNALKLLELERKCGYRELIEYSSVLWVCNEQINNILFSRLVSVIFSFFSFTLHYKRSQRLEMHDQKPLYISKGKQLIFRI